MPIEKLCLKCNRTLPIEAFYHNKKYPSNYSANCKNCAYTKLHLRENYIPTTKQCLLCNKVFKVNNTNHKYCSDACHRIAIGLKNVSYYRKCLACRTWFYTTNHGKLYCTLQCGTNRRAAGNDAINSAFHREYYLEKYNFTCQQCLNKYTTAALHCHHVIPLALGGSDRESNILVLCATCHSTKHSSAAWLKIKNDSKSAMQIAKGQQLLIKEASGVYIID
jgi:hypothetical protein